MQSVSVSYNLMNRVDCKVRKIISLTCRSTPSSNELLWLANSDVPFQSVTNDLLHVQFAMQTYALHWVNIKSELSQSGGLHMRRVITKQLMYNFGRVLYFYQ